MWTRRLILTTSMAAGLHPTRISFAHSAMLQKCHNFTVLETVSEFQHSR